MKVYFLRGEPFHIEDEDQLQFMADTRAIYNQVAEDVIEALTAEPETKTHG